MTCIVAIEHARGATIAADRCQSDGYSRTISARPKVFYNGEVLIASAGSVRQAQLLQHGFDSPTQSLGWDTDQWITRDLIPCIRRVWADHGLDWTRDNLSYTPGTFIVSVRGRVYTVHADWGWTRPTSGEHAIGSGADHALGSLAATRDTQLDPETRARRSVSIAALLGQYVAEPIDVVTQAAQS